MNRADFLKTLLAIPVMQTIRPVTDLNTITGHLIHKSYKMPAFFIGHGSPMNAIENNEFSLAWQKIGKEIPRPELILCVSAHWETRGTFITFNENPPTIHDFGGFPEELFKVEYPAKGSRTAAKQIISEVNTITIHESEKWGFDHGTWSILKHIYPDANVPVLQLSLDLTQSPLFHYELGKQLAVLREKGVLIIGSGNMVHNLRLVEWSKINQPEFGFDWAIEANETMKQLMRERRHTELVNFQKRGRAFDLAIPSPEHYLPLLYILAMQNNTENVSFFNDKAIMGSLTMTSLKIE